MKLRWVLAAFTLLACSLPAQTASALGAKIRDLSLDPNACYRIRDLSFQKGDASFYLTDGYLIFSKPIEDRVILAVFHATETIDDAEILLRPPDRGERASLAAFSGAPNLNEHFRNAVFLFTDGTGEELLKDLKSSPVTKPAPDMAALLESRFAGVGRNLARSFDVRLVHDLLSRHSAHGMFYAGIASARLGNFVESAVIEQEIDIDADTRR